LPAISAAAGTCALANTEPAAPGAVRATVVLPRRRFPAVGRRLAARLLALAACLVTLCAAVRRTPPARSFGALPAAAPSVAELPGPRMPPPAVCSSGQRGQLA